MESFNHWMNVAMVSLAAIYICSAYYNYFSDDVLKAIFQMICAVALIVLAKL